MLRPHDGSVANGGRQILCQIGVVKAQPPNADDAQSSITNEFRNYLLQER